MRVTSTFLISLSMAGGPHLVFEMWETEGNPPSTLILTNLPTGAG
jgi:surfactin synthase thioesterase subunit